MDRDICYYLALLTVISISVLLVIQNYYLKSKLIFENFAEKHHKHHLHHVHHAHHAIHENKQEVKPEEEQSIKSTKLGLIQQEKPAIGSKLRYIFNPNLDGKARPNICADNTNGQAIAELKGTVFGYTVDGKLVPQFDTLVNHQPVARCGPTNKPVIFHLKDQINNSSWIKTYLGDPVVDGISKQSTFNPPTYFDNLIPAKFNIPNPANNDFEPIYHNNHFGILHLTPLTEAHATALKAEGHTSTEEESKTKEVNHAKHHDKHHSKHHGHHKK